MKESSGDPEVKIYLFPITGKELSTCLRASRGVHMRIGLAAEVAAGD